MEKKTAGLIFFFLSLALMACMGTGSDDQSTEPDDLFLDYKIWGEEGNDSVTIMLFFREDGPTGPAVRIAEPGQVQLDGERLLPDSNDMTGVYYPATREISRFTGKHNIRFTSESKKVYREDFVFRPFALKESFPDTISRSRFRILLEGLNKQDMIRMLVSDTSFPGIGIDRLETVLDNQLVLTRGALSYLVNGPLFIELTKEAGWPMDKGTRAGGLVSISYTIRRESFLVD